MWRAVARAEMTTLSPSPPRLPLPVILLVAAAAVRSAQPPSPSERRILFATGGIVHHARGVRRISDLCAGFGALDSSEPKIGGKNPPTSSSRSLTPRPRPRPPPPVRPASRPPPARARRARTRPRATPSARPRIPRVVVEVHALEPVALGQRQRRGAVARQGHAPRRVGSRVRRRRQRRDLPLPSAPPPPKSVLRTKPFTRRR